MTQSNDVPTWLDRIEAVLEQLVERTNENTHQLTITMQAIDRLANVQIETLQAIAASQRNISAMPSEVEVCRLATVAVSIFCKVKMEITNWEHCSTHQLTL